MKKLAIVGLLGTVLCGNAMGAEFDPKFYVGAEAQYNKLKKGQNFVDPANQKSMIRKNTPGAGVFVGSRLTENLGAEVGYAQLGKSNKTFQKGTTALSNGTMNVKMHNIYVDALGYLPVADEVDVIGAVGVGRLTTKTQLKAANGTSLPITTLANVQANDAKSKAGIRLGLGAQYKFDTNIGVRAMVRHQKGNKVVKNVNSANVGLFYQF